MLYITYLNNHDISMNLFKLFFDALVIYLHSPITYIETLIKYDYKNKVEAYPQSNLNEENRKYLSNLDWDPISISPCFSKEDIDRLSLYLKETAVLCNVCSHCPSVAIVQNGSFRHSKMTICNLYFILFLPSFSSMYGWFDCSDYDSSPSSISFTAMMYFLILLTENE